MLCQDRREAEQFRRRHVCGHPDCRGTLVTYWDGQANSYGVRCGNWQRHDERFTRARSLTQAWREGEPTDIAIANRLETKYGGVPMDSTALQTIPEQAMVERVNSGLTRFGAQLDQAQQRALAKIALGYGLDPLMGELTVYEGKPYVTIHAYYRKAREHADYEGHQVTPVDADTKKSLGYLPADIVAKCELYLRGLRVPIIAYAKANRENPHRGSPIERDDPWRLAEKRAEMRAFKKGLGLDLPFGLADRGQHGEVVEVEARVVDAETGEIYEAESVAAAAITDQADTDDSAAEEAELALSEEDRSFLEAVANAKALKGRHRVTDEQIRHFCEKYGVTTPIEAPAEAKEKLLKELNSRIDQDAAAA